MSFSLRILSGIISIFSLMEGLSLDLKPVVKTKNEFTLPAHFRVFDSVSASGQFSEKNYEYLLETSPNQQWIVIDLRREYHGFVNGFPVSWKLTDAMSYAYNDGLDAVAIEENEKVLLSQMDGYTERGLVEQSGGIYIRFPVADHSFPSDEEADQFVNLIQSLPHNARIHLHCAGGSGRTTTFLSMIDMMHHSHSLSAEEILKRQETIGGSNLYDPESQYADEPERIEGAKARLQFLKAFHQKCLN
jgi:hypothetical protein